MASTYPLVPTTSLPFAEELVEAATAEAEADADRVAEFLRELGMLRPGESSVHLSADLLLFLGAVLRLNYWEESGLQVHRDVGLPTASKILADAIRSVTETGKAVYPKELCNVVNALFIDRFAWHGRRDLDAAVVLDSFDEDAALDALAELLWSQRLADRGGTG